MDPFCKDLPERPNGRFSGGDWLVGLVEEGELRGRLGVVELLGVTESCRERAIGFEVTGLIE